MAVKLLRLLLFAAAAAVVGRNVGVAFRSWKTVGRSVITLLLRFVMISSQQNAGRVIADVFFFFLIKKKHYDFDRISR